MARMSRALIASALAALVLAAPATASAANDRQTLHRYAADSWRSFEMLVDPASGLPSDNVSAAGVRSRYTSPTNIGAYMWSTLAARDLGIIKPREARARIRKTLTTLAGLERHDESGQFFNWYDPNTGAKLSKWPVDNSTVYPFLSS